MFDVSINHPLAAACQPLSKGNSSDARAGALTTDAAAGGAYGGTRIPYLQGPIMNKAATIALLLGALAAPFATPAFAVPLAETEAVTHEELNLSSLEERLKDTKAIPVLKKLSLKGEIDALLAQFRAAQPGGREELVKLRAPYNAMIDKIYALLKKDPALGQDILASRETIWGMLSDPTQVASLN
jgi:hypothetical protein